MTKDTESVELKVVCSINGDRSTAKPGKGVQWWKRSVHHIANARTNRTLCGRSASTWIDMDVSVSDALESPNCCERCQDKAHTLWNTRTQKEQS